MACFRALEMIFTLAILSSLGLFVHGQNIPDSKLVIENEVGILQQVKTIVSDFTRLRLSNVGTFMSSASYFLIASCVKIFSILDPLIFVEVIKRGIESRATCAVCNLFMSMILNDLFSVKVIIYTAKVVCSTFKIQRPDICEPMIESFQDTVAFLKYNTKLSSEEMCGVLIGDFCVDELTDKVFWYLNFTSSLQSLRSGRNPLITKKFTASKSDAITKFVQITDIHMDPKYYAGTNTFCGEPICCRKANGFSTDRKTAAGQWATYLCDSHITVTTDALKQVNETHPDARFWLWTGDNVHHESWFVTRDDVKDILKVTTDQFLPYLRQGVKIYPSLGNHDTVPLNSYAPPEIEDDSLSSSWLYEYAAELWTPFLPESALKTFRVTGSYTVRHSDHLVIVNLNSNYCYRLNMWTYYDSVDPGGQLTWLDRTLAIAETMNDQVLLVMHVPADRAQCTQGWLHNYMLIIERYSHIIKGQFSGHTHFDEMRIYFSLNDWTMKVMGVLFLAPAVTPYSGTNPSYRVFFMNESSSQLINYHSYSAHLSEANQVGRGNFKFNYDAKNFWSVASLNGHELNEAVTKMKGNDSFFNQYFHQVFIAKSNFDQFDQEWQESTIGSKKQKQINSMRVSDPYYWQPRPVLVDSLYTKNEQNKSKEPSFN